MIAPLLRQLKTAATLTSLLLAAMATSCAHWAPADLGISRPEQVGPGVSPSPDKPWLPPPGTVAAPIADASPAVVPPSYVPGSPITLAEIVDIALANNPATRIAWLQARAAEAQLGSSRAGYLPQLDLSAEVGRSRSGGGAGRTVVTQTTFGPTLTLSYLLFDFGGRSARAEQARQTLIAADFEHNAVIQNVVLDAQRAFYQYVEGKALLTAQAATVKELQTNLDAADARHSAGVATIADVLRPGPPFLRLSSTTRRSKEVCERSKDCWPPPWDFLRRLRSTSELFRSKFRPLKLRRPSIRF